MHCTVGQITDYDLKKIAEMPKRVELLVNDGNYFEEADKGFFRRLFSKSVKKTDTWSPQQNFPLCETDKAWHAIHFLLTGNSEEREFPLNFLMSGGVEIGDDMGYGPLRFLNASEVKELKFLLNNISSEKFRERYNITELNKAEIYPLYTNWSEDEELWISEEYEALRLYINQAYSNNNGIYIIIN